MVSLFPNVCNPPASPSLSTIRHFAKHHVQSLAAVLTSAGLPLGLIEAKLAAAKRFSLGVKRRTSIGHLAQAVRAVLELQPDMVRQMKTDWGTLDLRSIREQLAWVFRMSDSYCTGCTHIT